MDIRNFFGSKKVPPQSAPTKSSETTTKIKKSPKKSTENAVIKKADDSLLFDSDDENKDVKSRIRRRLKSNKDSSTSNHIDILSEDEEPVKRTRRTLADKSNATPDHVQKSKPLATPSSLSKTKKRSSPSNDVIESKTKSHRTNTGSDDKFVEITADRKPTLKPLSKDANSVKNVAETSVSDFFGVGPSATDSQNDKIQTPSKKLRATVSTSAKNDSDTKASSKSPASGQRISSASEKDAVYTTKKTSSFRSFDKGNRNLEPLNASSDRTVPVGKAGCLDGLKIAITGLLDTFGREEIEDLIKTYGGKVASQVSGKTDLLIVGKVLEDGREVQEGNKYKTAMQKKVTVVSEEEFLNRIRDSNTTSSSNAAMLTSQETVSSSSQSNSSSFNASAAGASLASRIKQRGEVYSNRSEKKYSERNSNSPQADDLWVDKHRPSQMSDMIGCGDTAKKLIDWLRRWEAVHIQKSVKIPFSKENPGAKAALLSGPPGIGKTTLANLAGRELRYEVLELNASDTRNKKAITEELSDVVLSKALSAEDSNLKRRLVIMDEVDGMGGSDRGGIPELIKVIKNSKVPIICICNDRQCQKIKTLANYCYDLRVRRPTKTQIATRLVQIAKSEGLDVEPNAAEMLVEQMGNDIRQVINCLQMWKANTNTMRFLDLKSSLSKIEKDKILRHSPFDACLQILGGQKTSIDERYNSFFIDYSLLPLLIQQNYIDAAKQGIFGRNSELSDDDKMIELSKAADAVSDMEMVGSKIIGADQHWELLPAQAAMSVKVGSIVHGFQAFPSFPAWLGRNSSAGKGRRLVRELTAHTSLAIGQGFLAMRLEYVPYLRSYLLRLLIDKGSDGVDEVVSCLDSYGLSRDDLLESMKDLQMIIQNDPVFQDHFARIDSKVKAGFTRTYNSLDHKSQALVSMQQIGKKSRRASTERDGDLDDDGMIGNTAEDLEAARVDDNGDDDDDVDMSAFVKKKPTKSKAKSSSAPAVMTKKGRGKL